MFTSCASSSRPATSGTWTRLRERSCGTSCGTLRRRTGSGRRSRCSWWRTALRRRRWPRSFGGYVARRTPTLRVSPQSSASKTRCRLRGRPRRARAPARRTYLRPDHPPGRRGDDRAGDWLPTIQSFRRERARTAASQVEVAGLAGHLVDQFLAKRSDLRTKKYGGDLEDRMHSFTRWWRRCGDQWGVTSEVVVA